MDVTQGMSIRYANSMKLFESGGVIYYGFWRRWQREVEKERRDEIFRDFESAVAARKNFHE